MRVLSIDYGKKRTGLAVTDPAQIIANALTTVDTSELMAFVMHYVATEPVERIVIGLPVQTNGLPSENQQRARRFGDKLQERLPHITVEYYDERFTSVLAHKAILDSGIGKKARRENKGLVDEVSATIILQDWMKANGR